MTRRSMLSLFTSVLAAGTVAVVCGSLDPSTATAKPPQATVELEPSTLPSPPVSPSASVAEHALAEGHRHLHDNPGLAAWHFGEACTDGLGEGCTRLASIVHRGDVIPRDPVRVRRLLRRGCAQGDLNACGWVD
ncbi:MAG: hypothetical protein K0V04_13255 [Deltaproteobacteria bacterium]|nr:hypothetical protein [Deltaproteobacteria bacterium]